MTRVLVVGVGPRPAAGLTRVYAPGLRFDSVARALIAAGHEVTLGEIPFAEINQVSTGKPVGARAAHLLPREADAAAQAIAAHANEARAEAVVALTDVGALAAVRSGFDGPLFVDYFGHPMVERQMLAFVAGNDSGLADQWAHVVPVLLRADRFSGCSHAQRHALHGELGAVGRLNAATCGEPLVEVLRPALPFAERFTATSPGFLRGGKVAADARIILFTGGYNTWLDEATLFAAVERVLAEEPSAVYVSTGGEIGGHTTEVFARFKARVEASAHRARFHFLGWIEHEQFIDCCLEADVGVFADHPTLEGEFGCRNRLFGWAWGGMRAVATDLCEQVRDELAPLGIVAPVACGDADAFAQTLSRELRAGRLNEDDAERQRAVLEEHCRPEVAYAPLLEWAASPARAADRIGQGRVRNTLADAHASLIAAQEKDAQVSELIARLEGSRLFGYWANRNARVRELMAKLKG